MDPSHGAIATQLTDMSAACKPALEQLPALSLARTVKKPCQEVFRTGLMFEVLVYELKNIAANRGGFEKMFKLGAVQIRYLVFDGSLLNRHRSSTLDLLRHGCPSEP